MPSPKQQLKKDAPALDGLAALRRRAQRTATPLEEGAIHLDIAMIRADGGTQPRAQIDVETLQEYAEDMRNGDVFPPVDVFYDGGSYWLADGFHRVNAAKMVGVTTILANVEQGTQRDAILYSVGVNRDHGLRRTNADKRRSVEKLLNDEEWYKWSDREIARRCGVSNRFVGTIRDELSVNGSQMPTQRMVQRGDQVYQQNVSSQRRQRSARSRSSSGGGSVSDPVRYANDEGVNQTTPRHVTEQRRIIHDQFDVQEVANALNQFLAEGLNVTVIIITEESE